MTKPIQADSLIILYNSIAGLNARDPARSKIIAEAATLYSVSPSTIYRALHRYKKPQTIHRIDYNKPRLISQSEMRYYCELIAALKLRTTNKKNRHLSTRECIRLLETYGIETPEGLIKAPVGLLKKSSISVYLKRFGLDKGSLSIEPTVVRFQAENSNECWHFDFSQSDLKYFEDDVIKKGESRPILMLASVVDDRSGVTYQEYHYVYGEDIMTGLKFLFNAMSEKKKPGFPFQGIPKNIYTDNGPVAKSNIFKRVMAYLNIEVLTHLPKDSDGRRKTARSKGKVERPFRTIKESLETFYHFHRPKTLEEANQWLIHYLERYNQEKHRYETHSRLEDWRKNLPVEGFRAMCDWERFTSLARDPEIRKVGSDACVTVNGTKYQLSNELAGFTVTLLWGLFDNELHAEYEGNKYGPFYPSEGPIPFGQYRSFKKSNREKKADKIEILAKNISISKAALTGDSNVVQLINYANLVAEKQNSVPFTLPDNYEATLFKNTIEAKTAIANWLGFPLGRLMPKQIAKINEIVAESLDKKVVMAKIKQLFALKLIKI